MRTVNAKKKLEKPVSDSNEFLPGFVPYLLNRLVREMLRGVDKKFQDRGLTVSKWRVLAVLSDRGTCGFGELVELTAIEPATLSRFIDALIQEGLVRRRRSNSDARAVKIALTDKGEAAFTETLPWACEVQNNLLRGLSPQDVAKMKAMLKILFANIHAGALDKKVSNESATADASVLDL